MPLERTDPVRRIDGDDIGVLEPGEGLILAEQFRRDFQGHRPVGKRDLTGQEHAAERPAA